MDLQLEGCAVDLEFYLEAPELVISGKWSLAGKYFPIIVGLALWYFEINIEVIKFDFDWTIWEGCAVDLEFYFEAAEKDTCKKMSGKYWEEWYWVRTISGCVLVYQQPTTSSLCCVQGCDLNKMNLLQMCQNASWLHSQGDFEGETSGLTR